MNWAAPQRTVFPCVRECLFQIQDGRAPIHEPNALGTAIYLEMVYYYMEIFISLTASLYDRIKYAGFVVTFLGIWRNYLILHPEYDFNTNIITRKTFQDVILSCHMAVNLITLFAEKYSYLECALDLTGTNCVETYFSMNGS